MKIFLRKLLDAMDRIENAIDRIKIRRMNRLVIIILVFLVTNPVGISIAISLAVVYGLFKLLKLILESLV